MFPGPHEVPFEWELTQNRRKQKNRKDRSGGRNMKCKDTEMKTSEVTASGCSGERRERRGGDKEGPRDLGRPFPKGSAQRRVCCSFS